MSGGTGTGLRDAFSRRIDYLRISVTDRCNLRCLYCMPRSGMQYFSPAEIMTSSEITRFVRVALRHGLRKVRITGGEPLLRGDIVPLVSSVKALGVRDLSMTTNGIFLVGLAAGLKKAGLDRVNISLDTLDAGRFRSITRGGDISRVRESIEEAGRVGLRPVKINVVPIRGINDDEVAEFAALTIERDCHIRFIELMPVLPHRKLREYSYLTKEELMKKIAPLGRLSRLPFKGGGPSRNYRLEGAKGIIGFISPMSNHFCNYCNRLRLTASGSIRPCLFSDREFDVKTSMREGASDEALEALFLSAVNAKPAGHSLHSRAPNLLSMSKIGG
jgi:cyclic pyranopterin phosphate synthase